MRGRWVAFVAFALVLSGCDWPMFMHDAAHSGVLLSAVAVSNGFIYATGEQLHAFAKP